MNARQIETERARLLNEITEVGNNRFRGTPAAEQALANFQTKFLQLGRKLQEQKEKARTRRSSLTTT